MPPEVPFYDEVAEYSFKVCRRVRIGLVAEREKTIHERFRQHQVAKSQRGEEHLVETAREDDGARPVQAAQGRHGPSGEPEFTVVIIFNHLRTRTPRRREQRQAAFERHSHTQRELVGRSHIHRPWLRTGAKGFGGVEYVPIDGHGHEPCSRIAERGGRAVVRRILNPDGIAALHQESGQQIEPLLRAGKDHDFIGRAIDAARGSQVIGDSLA